MELRGVGAKRAPPPRGASVRPSVRRPQQWGGARGGGREGGRASEPGEGKGATQGLAGATAVADRGRAPGPSAAVSRGSRVWLDPRAPGPRRR